MKVRRRTIYGAGLLAVLCVAALLAPQIAPLGSAMDPHSLSLSAANLPVGAPGHPLGTDYLGRDLLGEAIWGARASLTVGIVAAGLAVTFGVFWGAVGAVVGGIVDSFMMRVVDGLLAIPSIILLLALQSLISTAALETVLPRHLLQILSVTSYSHGLLPLIVVVFVVSATSWLEAARVARAQVLSIKSQEYYAAAEALGVGFARLLFRHLLPNAQVVIAVELTLLISDAVLMEAGLSFLGLGLGPAIPSWGGMLASAQSGLVQGNWWAALVPGAMITSTVLAVNMLGDGWLDITGLRHHRAAGRSGL